MAGTLPLGNGTFDLQVGTIVDWSHDTAEAERLIERGYAEELSPSHVAGLTAAGTRVQKHPLAAHAKRKK